MKRSAMRKSVMVALVLAMGIIHVALAQEAAVYRDKVLTIPSGVIIDDQGVTAVRDVTLIQEEDGRFRVDETGEGQLAEVDSVTVTSVESTEDRVKVTAEGYQSSACVDILMPAMVRDDNVFSVVLSESAQWSDVCILIMKRYEKSFPLDVRGLEPGTYLVIVNGVEAEFTL